MTPKTKKESTPAPSGAAAPASSAVPAKKSSSSSQNAEWTSATFVSNYVKTTPQRTKLIDLFMAYLMVVGAIQFLYCFVGSYVRGYCPTLLLEHVVHLVNIFV